MNWRTSGGDAEDVGPVCLEVLEMAPTTEPDLNDATEIALRRVFQDQLSGAFRSHSEHARETVALAVGTLAEHALRCTSIVTDDAYRGIESIIAELDARIAKQVDSILHHRDFQAMESAWRGLHYLVANTESDEQIRIRVMDVSKRELQANLRRHAGVAWDQSPLFKRVYEEEYGQLGGQPYGCLVADYYFDHSPGDAALLSDLAKIAAAAHAPLITGASPALLQMDSWQALANPRDLSRILQTAEYTQWNALRDSEDARYVALAMPRFLGRLPYGIATNPVDQFQFEEGVDGLDHEKYTWINAAYAMAVNINRAFKLHGWCTLIRGVESGGLVENLPAHRFATDDGGVDLKCPTELAISDRRETELSRCGLSALVHRKNTPHAAFIGAQSLQRPATYADPDATANANLSARLPYLFACSRFAHYLKCIARDKIGSFKGREDMQRWLSEWIMSYVDADPANSSQDTKACRPLAAAEVIVDDVEGNPGYYSAKFFLRPHFQLEGMTASLRLVARLPAVGANT
jgi:type VI secretion system protein ImpC